MLMNIRYPLHLRGRVLDARRRRLRRRQDLAKTGQWGIYMCLYFMYGFK